MTALELVNVMNNEFGLDKWPTTYEVDHETFANVCRYVFEWNLEHSTLVVKTHEFNLLTISVGLHNGIMFKNVELILKS